jgi:hypothetical protein
MKSNTITAGRKNNRFTGFKIGFTTKGVWMNKQQNLSELDARIHEEDIQRMAVKVYKEMKKEMAKYKLRVDYFSAYSLAHLHTILLVLAANEMETFAKSPNLSMEIIGYVKRFIEKQEEKFATKH